MARAPKTADVEKFEGLKKRSGWYLAAWRHYRNLTLQDVADETGLSRSYISELESGKERYNRDTHAAMSKALGVSLGFLIDINPYRVTEGYQLVADTSRALAEDLARRGLKASG